MKEEFMGRKKVMDGAGVIGTEAAFGIFHDVFKLNRLMSRLDNLIENACSIADSLENTPLATDLYAVLSVMSASIDKARTITERIGMDAVPIVAALQGESGEAGSLVNQA